MADKVVHIQSADQLRGIISSAGEKLVIIDFTASWCPPCRMIAPIYAQLSLKYPNVAFLKVDVDECQDIQQAFKIRAMPTFVFLKKGQEVDRQQGADANGLEQKIQKYPSAPAETFVGSGRTLGAGTGVSRLVGDQPPVSAAPRPAAAPVVIPVDDEDNEDAEMQAALALSLSPDQQQAAALSAPAAAAAVPKRESVVPDPNLLVELLSMGFSESKCRQALIHTNNASLDVACDWVFQHLEDPDVPIGEEAASASAAAAAPAPAAPRVMTPEEEEAHQRQVRAAALKMQEDARRRIAEAERKAELEREKARRESGKNVLKTQEAIQDQERRKAIEETKRQKEADKKHMDELRKQLERDKAERAAARAAASGGAAAAAAPAPVVAPVAVSAAPAAGSYDSCTVQVRMFDGSTIKKDFKPSDTLAQVARFVMQSAPSVGSAFSFTSPGFPKKTYTTAQFASVSLEAAELVPRGQLILTRQ